MARDRIRSSGLAFALVVLTGCGIGSETLAVYVTGAVAQADGSPAPRTRVALVRNAGLIELFAAGGGPDDHRFLDGAGLPCTSGDPCTVIAEAKTDPEGRFKTQSAPGEIMRRTELLHLLAFPPDADQRRGPFTARSFTPDRNQIKTNIVGWDPHLRYTDQVATWDPAPAELGEKQVRFRLYFDDAESKTSLNPSSVSWSFNDVAPGVRIDLRLLEDGAGDLALLGISGSTTYRSALVAYQGTAGAPVSRGAECLVRGEDGNIETPSSCSLTNGNFRRFDNVGRIACRGPHDPGDPCSQQVTWASIDLGRELAADLVALRGCSEACQVEFSTDGRDWSRAQGEWTDYGPAADAGKGSYLTLAPSGLSTGRYVRVLAAKPGDLENLKEVSVWERKS